LERKYSLKVLFITLTRIDSFIERGNYQDLINEFYQNGDTITVVCPNERRFSSKTEFFFEKRKTLLRVLTPNIQKVNFLEKFISTLLIEYLFFYGIVKYLSHQKYDLIIYSTPPITIDNLIILLKKKFNAKTYLLLKDIFPQNAVDLGIINDRSLMYKYFRKREKKLYKISDKIGVMSNANKKYIIKNNPYLGTENIEINYNSIQIFKTPYSTNKFKKLEQKLNKRVVYVFGGNLGKPQGIEFLLELINAFNDNDKIMFLIIGSGTEEYKIRQYIRRNNPNNMIIMEYLSKSDFDYILRYCDVGLVSLRPVFSIPNYPSRILSYMHNKLPILCMTDEVSDVGKDAEENNYGFYCKHGDLNGCISLIDLMAKKKILREEMGNSGYNYLQKKFNVKSSYNLIKQSFINN
jgi:glycosyltransferase involved in cell wall biosynthesis